MKQYKKDFIEFMLDSDVLQFGDFITKSGRKTPYFINTGKYDSGERMEQLGRFYAECLEDNVRESISAIYGPAYKGIPLAVSTVIALNNQYGKNLNYTFNRKEAKDHGEQGSIVGYLPQDGDKVVIVDDVITAGLSIRESIELLNSIGKVEPVAIVISVDRMEKGANTDKSARRDIEETFGIPIYPIVTIEEVVEYIFSIKEGGKAIIDENMRDAILQRIA